MDDEAKRRELASYAGACLSLYLQLHQRGGTKLGHVEAHLCEDDQTVALSAWDQEISASFTLAEKTNQGDFDHRWWESGFDEADAFADEAIGAELDRRFEADPLQLDPEVTPAGTGSTGSCELKCDVISGQGGDRNDSGDSQ